MLMTAMTRSLALAATAVLLVTSLPLAQAYRPGDESCVVGPGSPCNLDQLKVSNLDGSTLVYPGGATRCAFDDFSHPDTSFTANATFFFQVFPNQHKDNSKLLIYLQGGGACIDDDTCNFELQCSAGSSSTFIQNAAAMSTGVLNRADTRNYFHDWNIVHVPYCTGDLHFGSKKVAAQSSPFAAQLGKKACLNQNRDMHMNGFANANSAFQWARANFPAPREIVFAGASAGALGVQLMSNYIAQMWDVQQRSIALTVLADSYVGVAPEDKSAGRLVNYLNACSLDLGLPQDLVAKCLKHQGTVTEFISAMIRATPFSEWFFINSKADKTQRKFYAMFDKGLAGFPFSNLIPEDQFFNGMSTILNAYKAISSRVSTFFADGQQHQYLPRDNWYSSQRSESGETLSDVLGGAVARANTKA